MCEEYVDGIPEFNQADILSCIEKGETFDYERVYHDSFQECNELYQQLQAKIPEYRLLGLFRMGYIFLRYVKQGQLFLIHEKTLKPLLNEPIDYACNSFNSPEFVVRKGSLSAVFDGDGNQLTPFVGGMFCWKTVKSTKGLIGTCFRRIIYNKEASIELELDD